MWHFAYVDTIVEKTSAILTTATHTMPHAAWWVAGLVALILFLTAVIDGFTSMVPSWLVFLGIIATVVAQGLYISWAFAAQHFMWAIAIAAAILLINALWYRIFQQDALGSGDATWSMLAAACFDLTPVLYAWGIAAWLALIWIAVIRTISHQITRVYFAPFLFLGLCISLYWLRFR